LRSDEIYNARANGRGFYGEIVTSTLVQSRATARRFKIIVKSKLENVFAGMSGSSPTLNRQILLFMELCIKKEPDTFHYITSVTLKRVPIFRIDKACEIFVGQLGEVREKFPYKLIGYVVMPDHFHLIVNLKDDNESKFLLRLRGLSARKVIAWPKEGKYGSSLEKLKLRCPQKRQHQYAVWQRKPMVVELYSHKFCDKN